jgi:hypothetical protein
MDFAVRTRPRERLLAEYLLSRVDLLKEEKMSSSSLAQDVFLLKHRKELSNLVVAGIVPKILQDIDTVLKEGCAEEISEMDFNHAHLCSLSPLPLFDLRVLLSEDNVGLLYHTHEQWPYNPRRNIKSTLLTQAEVVPIPYTKYAHNYGGECYSFSKVTVYSSELGWFEWGKIRFKQDPNGPHQLKSGAKLDMTGELYNTILLHTTIKDGIIKVDGQQVGETHPFG